MDTYNKILTNARKLFNEKGFSKVTMRGIASECDISVGNLTYYFAKKLDIVTALMNMSYSETKPEKPIETLNDVTDQFSRMLATIRANAFYFLDDEFLVVSRSHSKEIQARLLAGFDTLIEKGYFSSAFTKEKQCDTLLILMFSHITWLRDNLRATTISEQAFLDIHWVILKPYLTEKGLNALDGMA